MVSLSRPRTLGPEVLDGEITPYVRWVREQIQDVWDDDTAHPNAPTRWTASAGHCGLLSVILLPELWEGWWEWEGRFLIAHGNVEALINGRLQTVIDGHTWIIGEHEDPRCDLDIIDGTADQAEGIELEPCIVAPAGLVGAMGIKYVQEDTYDTVEAYQEGVDGSNNLGGRVGAIGERLRLAGSDISVAAFTKNAYGYQPTQP
jgi:hypothetical protein